MPPGDYAILVNNAEGFPGDLEPWQSYTGDSVDLVANWESAWIDIGGEG